jgi:hypothetical protein
VVHEDVSLHGEVFAILIAEESLLKVYNTPRSDANHYDLSGPMKIGITVKAGGRSHELVLPVRLQSVMIGNTAHRKVDGSRVFHIIV